MGSRFNMNSSGSERVSKVESLAFFINRKQGLID